MTLSTGSTCVQFILRRMTTTIFGYLLHHIANFMCTMNAYFGEYGFISWNIDANPMMEIYWWEPDEGKIGFYWHGQTVLDCGSLFKQPKNWDSLALIFVMNLLSFIAMGSKSNIWIEWGCAMCAYILVRLIHLQCLSRILFTYKT